jgi:hypothetical protein
MSKRNKSQRATNMNNDTQTAPVASLTATMAAPAGEDTKESTEAAANAEPIQGQPGEDNISTEEAELKTEEKPAEQWADDSDINMRKQMFIDSMNRAQAETLARYRSERMLGGPLPEFDLEKANATIEIDPEPEPVIEEVEPEEPGAWIGYAQRVLGYEGDDSVEAWQLACRNMPEMMRFYNHVPSNKLLLASQIEYMLTAMPAEEEPEVETEE